MSNYTVSFDNDDMSVTLPRLTLGDTITVTKGSGYSKDTHYKCVIRWYGGDVITLPSDDSYSTSSTFSYTFNTNLVNTDLLDVWGCGYAISFRAYQQVSYTIRGTTTTVYNYCGYAVGSSVLQVDTTQYHPTLTLGNVYCADSKNYKGLLLAGISKIACSVATGHNKSDDKATLDDPTGALYISNSGLRGGIEYSASTKTLTSTSEIPTSTNNYTVAIYARVKDGRYVYQDGTKGNLPGTISVDDAPGYVKSPEVTVYSYAYPTYNPTYTYINRCTASGRADGMGAYARIHIHYAISKVDGDNVLNDIILRVNGSDCTQYRINSNWKTTGYADYLVPLAVGESGNIEITMTDSVCVALGTTSVITSLSVPKATLPLSLFDDGTNRGTAFGQMATRPGNWFYNNLVFVRDNTPYLLDIDYKKEITARQLIGSTGSRKLNVMCEIQGNYNAVTQAYFQVWNNMNVGREADISIMGTTDTQRLVVSAGTTIAFKGEGSLDYNVNKHYLNRTTELTEYFTVGTSWYYYITVTEDCNITFYTSSTEPPYPADNRPLVNVSASGASVYSLWDEDMMHVVDNGSMSFYQWPSGSDVSNKIKLHQQCLDKKFVHWSVGSNTYTEDYMANTGVDASYSTATNIVAVYEDLPAPQITITVIGHNNGWATISVNGTSVYDKEPPTGTVTISANQNSSLSIYYFDSNRINDIRINGTSHKSMTMEQTLEYTASDDTTIEFY